MPSPAIRKYRVKLGLSQGQLAELAATSARKIARLEAGVQRCGIRLAGRISKALAVPVEKLFPGSSKLLTKLYAAGHLSAEEIATLGSSGIDGDLRTWTANIRFRGSRQQALSIDGPDFLRMFGALQRTGHEGTFFIFDSEGERVLVNLDHVVLCQFSFEVDGEHSSDEDEEDYLAKVLLADGSDEIAFSVDFDQASGDDDIGQFSYIFSMAGMWRDESGDTFVAHFEDENGEDVFLRMADVAMFSVPVEAVDTSALEEYEGDTTPDQPERPPPVPEPSETPPARPARRRHSGNVVSLRAPKSTGA